MIKYNKLVCRYDKILIHVAAYVIPPHTHTHTHTQPKHVGVILILSVHYLFVHMLVL